MDLVRRSVRLGWPVPPAALAVLAATLLFEQWHPTFRNPNEVSRIYLTRAIVEDGSLSTDAQIAAHGMVEDRALFEGRHYSDKAPGLSLLAVPFYAVARVTGPLSLATSRRVLWLATVVLPSFLFLLALNAFLLRLRMRHAGRSLVIVAVGLGSLVATFTTLVFGHALAASLVGGAFLCAAAGRRQWLGPRALVVAGALAGWAAITEFPTATIGLLLLVYVYRTGGWPAARRYVTAASVPLAVLLLYNLVCFDNPFSLPVMHVVKPEWAAVFAHGLWGISLPRADALLHSLVSTNRGLLALAPWLAVAAAGLVGWARQPSWRAEAALVGAVVVTYLVFIASFGDWQAGGTVGPRHLTPLVGLLALPFATVERRLRRLSSPVPRALLAGSVVLAVVLTAGASVPWPYPSPSYINPWAEVALPAWREVALPPSTLGLSGVAARALFLGLVGGVLLVIAVGPAARRPLRQIVHASVSIAFVLVGVRIGSQVQVRADLLSHRAADRVAIVDIVDWQRRRPAAIEEDALLATSRSLLPHESFRLGYLKARRGELTAALEAYPRPGAGPEGRTP